LSQAPRRTRTCAGITKYLSVRGECRAIFACLLPPTRTLRQQKGPSLAPLAHSPESPCTASRDALYFHVGSYRFQDQFGQRPRSKAEYEQEVKRAEELEATFKRVLSKHHAERGEPPPVFEDD
jgi:hypothetical protein